MAGPASPSRPGGFRAPPFRERGGSTDSPGTNGAPPIASDPTAFVPVRRHRAPQGEIVIAASVRGIHWADPGLLWNWIAGRGSMDVPAYSPGVLVDDGESHAFTFRTKPRFQTTRYAYSVLLTSPSSETQDSPAVVTIGSESIEIGIVPRTVAVPTTIIVERAAQSSDVADLSLTIEMESSQCNVECISIEALPRLRLDDATADLGLDIGLVRNRAPITERAIFDTFANRISDIKNATRRVGLWQCARGDVSPWTISSGTYGALTQDAIHVGGRYLYQNGTEATVSWAALVKCSDGSTAGDLRVNNTSQGTGAASLAIPAGTTSWTWIAGSDFTCDSEDPTEASGLLSGGTDDHQIEGRRTAGAGTISIATVSLYDGSLA